MKTTPEDARAALHRALDAAIDSAAEWREQRRGAGLNVALAWVVWRARSLFIVEERLFRAEGSACGDHFHLAAAFLGQIEQLVADNGSADALIRAARQTHEPKPCT